LADPVDVKKADQLCETVSQPFIQPDKGDWPMGSRPRPCLDFDRIGQNWEGSNRNVWGPFNAQKATWKANVVFWRFEITQTTIADGSKRMPLAGCTMGGDDRE